MLAMLEMLSCYMITHQQILMFFLILLANWVFRQVFALLSCAHTLNSVALCLVLMGFVLLCTRHTMHPLSFTNTHTDCCHELKWLLFFQKQKVGLFRLLIKWIIFLPFLFPQRNISSEEMRLTQCFID